MPDVVGNNILSKVKLFNEKGIEISSKSVGESITLLLSSTNYKIKIIINPKQWLGLEFWLKDNNGRTILTYDIDTDLYPISRPKYHNTAEYIENEICEFLDSLINNRILVGEIKGKPAMIIPKKDGYLLVKRGWFFISSRLLKKYIDAESKGRFQVLS